MAVLKPLRAKKRISLVSLCLYLAASFVVLTFLYLEFTENRAALCRLFGRAASRMLATTKNTQADKEDEADIFPIFEETAKDSKCRRWQLLSAKLRECILKGALSAKPGELWLYLSASVETCAVLMRELLKPKFYSNLDDVKGLIDIATEASDQTCTGLTIGVGGDVLAEQRLLKHLPNCKLTGADPIPKSGAVFATVGDYYPVAISNETGYQQASILPDPQHIFNYTTRTVRTISLQEFMLKYQKSSRLDFVFMDGEGVEYKLLPYIMAHPNLVICQLSVELHGPPQQYGLRDSLAWDDFVFKFLQESAFLPLWVPEPSTVRHRMFAINVEHPYCVDKYFRYWCD